MVSSIGNSTGNKEFRVHYTLNHSAKKNLAWFEKEYLDSMAYITAKGTDEVLASCNPCVIGKFRRKVFVSLSRNRDVPLDAVFFDTIGPILQESIDFKSIYSF